MKSVFLVVAAIVTIIGCGTSLNARLLFSDNFDIDSYSYDINQSYDQGRQSGSLGNITWSNRPEHNPGTYYTGHVIIHHPWCESTLEFFVYNKSWPDYYGGPYGNYAWASPNHNFIDSGMLDIEFDVDPIGPSSDGDATNHFAAVVFGADVQGAYAIPMSGSYVTPTSPGMSFWLQDEGGWSVQSDDKTIASGVVANPKPGPNSFYHVKLEITTNGFGTGADALVNIIVDGQQVYSGVRTGGFANNYITLSALGLSDTQYNMSQFDNFSVATVPDPIPLSKAKKEQDGVSVCVKACVSAKFGDFFYIENRDRSCGMRVVAPDSSIDIGKEVKVYGTVSTLDTQERAIINTSVVALSGSQSILPLGVSNKGMAAPGVDNTGLLVRTVGKITSARADGGTWSLTITDGSGPDLHVKLPSGVFPPPTNSYIAVTGINSRVNTGEVVPMLLASRIQDMQEINAPVIRRLLIDDTFIESYKNLTRQLHPLSQYPGNPIIVQDKTWECHADFRYYPSVVMWANPVMRDPATGKFRMWYSGYCDKDPQGRDTELLMYAESSDGINWVKPNVGLVEWNGSRANNIVMAGITDGRLGTARYLDTPNIIYRPNDPNPMNRYIMFAAHWTGNGLLEGVWVYRSSDGFQWAMLKGDAVPNAREFNSFFWDPMQGKFIGNVRIRNPMLPRHVGYAESKDGINWTPAEIILAPANLNTPYNIAGDDVYGLVSFRYQSHCIGFLHAHHTDRRLEVQLMTSMNGRNWDFVANGQYILPNDPPGGYGQGMMSTQCGEPIRIGDELWIYIGIAPAAHTNPAIQPGPGQQKRAIGLAKIRVDGFVSMDAGSDVGELITKPFTTLRSRLYVNANAVNGSIRAEVLDSTGKPIDGLTSTDCIPVTGDSVSREIRWSSGARIPTNKIVKIRFLLSNASICSYWTED